MTRFALAALIALLPLAALAADPKTPDLSPPDSWVERGAGTIRVLDKLDSTVRTLTLKVGEKTDIGSLSLTLAGCYVRPPDLPPDAAAHLVITDAADQQATVFDGWMLHDEPNLGMLEHPVYDVQLAGCS